MKFLFSIPASLGGLTVMTWLILAVIVTAVKRSMT